VTKGTVRWFNNQKGFGFIHPTDGRNDVLSFNIVADRRTGKSSADKLRS